MRDRDTAGQPGGRLLLARHRGGDQPGGVLRAARIGEPVYQPPDDRLLVSARIDVEEDQIGVDDRKCSCHGDTFVLAAMGVTRTALRSICAGVGSADPGSAPAAPPYATAICSRCGGTAPPTSARI